MTKYPECPELDGETGRPRNRGDVFDRPDGSLFYCSGISGNYERAVRLDSVRLEVIERCVEDGMYRFSRRQGKNFVDITSFLEQDRRFSGEWEYRPELLSRIMSSDDQHSSRPTDYVRHEGRVLLDPYGHGIRDFPNELPVTLSTELEGWEIEYYLRKNKEITIYDLMARMLSTYKDSKGITHDDPPSILDLTERAKEFRERAALPAIDQQADSEGFRAQVMILLPDGATDIRSLRRDRTDEEIDTSRRERESARAQRRNDSNGVRNAQQTSPNDARSVNAASNIENGHGLQQNKEGSPFISAEEMGSWTNIPEGPIMCPSLPETPNNQHQWAANGPQGIGPGQGQWGLNQRISYDNMPVPLQTPPYTNAPSSLRDSYPTPNIQQQYPTPPTNSNPYASSMGPPPAPQNGVKRSLKRSLPQVERSPSPPKRQRTQNVPNSQQALFDHQRRARDWMDQAQRGYRAPAVGGTMPPPGSGVSNPSINGQSVRGQTVNGQIINQQQLNNQAAQTQRLKRRLDQALPEADQTRRPDSPKRQRKGKEVESRKNLPKKQGSRALHQPKCFYRKVETPSVDIPESFSVVLEPSNDFYGKPRRRVRGSGSLCQPPARFVLVNKTERSRAQGRNQLLKDALRNFSSELGHQIPPQQSSAQLSPEIAGVVNGLQNVSQQSRASQSASTTPKSPTGTANTTPDDGSPSAGPQRSQSAASAGSPGVAHETPVQTQPSDLRSENDTNLVGSNGTDSPHIHDAPSQNQSEGLPQYVDPRQTTYRPMEDTTYLAMGISDPVIPDYTGFEDYDWRAEINDQPSNQSTNDNTAQVQESTSAAPLSADLHSEQSPAEAGPSNNEERHETPTDPLTDTAVGELSDGDFLLTDDEVRPDQAASGLENHQQTEADSQPLNQNTSHNAPQPQNTTPTVAPSANDSLEERMVAGIRAFLAQQEETSLDSPSLDH